MPCQIRCRVACGPDAADKSRRDRCRTRGPCSTNSRSSPSLRSHQASKDGNADQMSQAGAMEAGDLVGDDDRSAGPGHPAHLAQGGLVIAEVVEPADRPAGVERRVGEGQVLGLGPGEPPGHRGMPVFAGFELGPGDVDAVDGPSRGQEAQVLPVADPDLERERRAGFRPEDMAKDLHACLANPALEHQEGLFPRPEPDPARAVVESGDDPVAARQRSDRFEDSVAERISAPALEAGLLPLERAAAGQAARRSTIDGAAARETLAGWFIAYTRSSVPSKLDVSARGPNQYISRSKNQSGMYFRMARPILMSQGKMQLRGRRSMARTRWRAASSGSIILTGLLVGDVVLICVRTNPGQTVVTVTPRRRRPGRSASR